MSDMIFQRVGNCFIPQRGAMTQYEELPPGTYSVEVHNNAFHLVLADDMATPGKIYGSTEKRAQRVVKAFLSRVGITTGALANGVKGTGKTHLAKRISEILRTQHKIPTLIISQPFAGSSFSQFIADIKQPCFVLIDEAEKIYHTASDSEGNNHHQNQVGLLPLLDGAFSTHKLFMLITNHAELHDSLMDRPGRVHYRWNYQRLEDDVVREYTADHLKKKEDAAELLALMRMVQVSSFDVLKGIIWEMNEFGERAFTAVRNLNITWSPKRHMVADVAGVAQSKYEGQHWNTTMHFDALELNFTLRLERKPNNDVDAQEMADVRQQVVVGMSYAMKRPPQELMDKYEAMSVHVNMNAKNFVQYLQDEDVYEFQNEDFFVRLKGVYAAEQPTAEVDMETAYPGLNAMMGGIPVRVVSIKLDDIDRNGPEGATS
jgi:hypothetical protein